MAVAWALLRHWLMVGGAWAALPQPLLPCCNSGALRCGGPAASRVSADAGAQGGAAAGGDCGGARRARRRGGPRLPLPQPPGGWGGGQGVPGRGRLDGAVCCSVAARVTTAHGRGTHVPARLQSQLLVLPRSCLLLPVPTCTDAHWAGGLGGAAPEAAGQTGGGAGRGATGAGGSAAGEGGGCGWHVCRDALLHAAEPALLSPRRCMPLHAAAAPWRCCGWLSSLPLVLVGAMPRIAFSALAAGELGAPWVVHSFLRMCCSCPRCNADEREAVSRAAAPAPHHTHRAGAQGGGWGGGCRGREGSSGLQPERQATWGRSPQGMPLRPEC